MKLTSVIELEMMKGFHEGLEVVNRDVYEIGDGLDATKDRWKMETKRLRRK